MIGWCAFESIGEIYYGIEPYYGVFKWFHLMFPDNYTFSEALIAFRALMPLFLQASLVLMDNSFDVLPEF